MLMIAGRVIKDINRGISAIVLGLIQTVIGQLGHHVLGFKRERKR
jgi:hypothetical protein